MHRLAPHPLEQVDPTTGRNWTPKLEMIAGTGKETGFYVTRTPGGPRERITADEFARLRAEEASHLLMHTSPLARQEGGSHYKDLKIQPLEYIHANGIPFAEGCVIKYVSRWRAKGGIKDLEKAKHFIELLIELETRDGRE